MNQWLQLKIPTETPIGYHTRPPTPFVGYTGSVSQNPADPLYLPVAALASFRAIPRLRVRAVRRWWLPGLSSCTEEPFPGSFQVRIHGGGPREGKTAVVEARLCSCHEASIVRKARSKEGDRCWKFTMVPYLGHCWNRDGGWLRRIPFDDSCTIEKYGNRKTVVCLAQELDEAGFFWGVFLGVKTRESRRLRFKVYWEMERIGVALWWLGNKRWCQDCKDWGRRGKLCKGMMNLD